MNITKVMAEEIAQIEFITDLSTVTGVAKLHTASQEVNQMLFNLASLSNNVITFSILHLNR